MKTRYFKSGLLTSAAALLCAVAGVSCTAEDIEVGQEIDNGLGAVYEINLSLQDANTAKSENVVGLYNDSYRTAIRLSTTKTPAAALTATAVYDAAYRDKYNAANGTDYELYPEELVTFDNEGVFTIEKNAVNTTLGMTVAGASEALDPDKIYMLPVAVTTTDAGISVKENAGHCVYLFSDLRHVPGADKGADLPKGFLFFEVNDTNPLNALACQLEDGRLIWDVVVLFAANINYDSDNQRPYIKCNPNVQFLLDNNEEFLQPLRKRGIKVLLGLLGNHDMAGLAQLSKQGAKDFAAEVARYCEAYNLDGVNYDDEYSASPDLNNPAFDQHSTAAAARLCYETKKAMPDKLMTVFDWGAMYGTATVDDVDADEWIDVVVANYGSTAYPVGKMSYKKCSMTSTEFNLGGGSNFSDYSADQIVDRGYGWYMGFALWPDKNGTTTSFWNQLRRMSGLGKLFGSPLKEPTFYYKKNDPKPYPIE